MCFQDVVFPPHFLKIVAEVKVSGSPHALYLWSVGEQGMLPVKYIRSN